MIFVTVGTHEQGFERLIKEIDKLKENGIIEDEVIIQKGYTKYEPKYCETYDLIDYDKLQRYLEEEIYKIKTGRYNGFIRFNVLFLSYFPFCFLVLCYQFITQQIIYDLHGCSFHT